MEWLTPMIAVYAAAIVLPLFLLLYFLKLRRREQIISSTLLWKRAVQDLQVNAPFQRIRRNILFFLQLLMFLAMLLAIAQPILSLVGGPSRRFVILIDRSASMNSTDGGTNRLEEAKRQAKTFVESMRDSSLFSFGESGDQAMVIAFDNRPKVMCSFTSNKRQLIAAIDLITPTDGRSLLAEAVTVARAFAQSVTTEANNRSAEEPAKLLLFSDGCIEDIDQISVAKDELSFYSTGESGENVAVTAMKARRSYETPEKVDVFAMLSNFTNQEINTNVQLSLNGNVQVVKQVKIPPREAAKSNEKGRPGNVSIEFSLSYGDRGVVEVRHLHKDVLVSDDAVWAVIFPPRKLSVLLVTSGNFVLESALRACPIANLKVSSPEQFDTMSKTLVGGQQEYDVIIIDNHIPKNLARGRYIVFGRPPGGIDVTAAEEMKDQVIIDWRARHPVLNYVNLENLFAAKFIRLNLPRDSEVLAEFNNGVAMAMVRRNASVFLLVPFDILETNWPFDSGLVLFCYNAVEFLSEEGATGNISQLRTGQPLIVDGFAPEISAEISGPGFSEKEVKAGSTGSIFFDSVDRVGIYSLNVTGQIPRYFAVNLLDQKESDIEAVSEISLSGEVVKAQAGDVRRANVPAWPFLTGFILCIAILEWLIYNMKVRI